jgi:hypothetical protein
MYHLAQQGQNAKSLLDAFGIFIRRGLKQLENDDYKAIRKQNL